MLPYLIGDQQRLLGFGFDKYLTMEYLSRQKQTACKSVFFAVVCNNFTLWKDCAHLNGPPDKTCLQNALAASLKIVTDFLTSSRVVQLAVLKNDGTIRVANQALAECLKRDNRDLVGQSLQNFLTEPDGSLFSRWLSGAESVPDRMPCISLMSSRRSVRRFPEPPAFMPVMATKLLKTGRHCSLP